MAYRLSVGEQKTATEVLSPHDLAILVMKLNIIQIFCHEFESLCGTPPQYQMSKRSCNRQSRWYRGE